jgi:aminopeptidase C
MFLLLIFLQNPPAKTLFTYIEKEKFLHTTAQILPEQA